MPSWLLFAASLLADGSCWRGAEEEEVYEDAATDEDEERAEEEEEEESSLPLHQCLPHPHQSLRPHPPRDERERAFSIFY